MPDFARKIVLWQRRHGRHDLPWQRSRDPYRIWVAEIMLQQTQVAAAIPYYERFLKRFPDVAALARASEDEVLRLWSGLGYYARARNLRAAAREVVKGKGFPGSSETLAELPGIGRSTAAAIAAFAYGERAAILDGNVKRVLARNFGIEGEKRQWALAESLLPPGRSIVAYTQGLMDLGATICTRGAPSCARCPLARGCVARRENRIAELPARRKRVRVPTRRATWLVLLHRGEVLLERRPSTGLWGGLWTFPENSSIKVSKTRRLPVVEHGFTHFRLKARPVLCEVGAVEPQARAQAEAPGRMWLGLEEAARAAVPAPVRKLLLGLLRDRRDE